MKDPPCDHTKRVPGTSGSANLKRRRLLFALGAASMGTAAVASSAIVANARVIGATATTLPQSGYRETEHVRDYYDSARI